MIRTARIDRVCLVAVLFLTIYGLVMISSASAIVSHENFGRNNVYFFNQIKSIAMGLVALFFFMNVNYRVWWRLSLPVGLFTVILLSMVFVPGIGSSSGTGSMSWIHVPMLPSIQPAEIAKLTLLMFLAAIFSGEKRVDVNPQFFSIGAGLALLSALMSIVFGQPLLGGVVSLAAIYFIYRFGGVAKNLYEGLGVFSAILLAVVGLVAAQPDWGTSLIMVCMSVGLFFVAGAKLKYFAVSGIVAAGALTPIVMSKQYIADRFSAFLNPTADVLGAGYHLYQSLLAIGSGGFFGLGFGFSRQKYEYLPEAHADSIFAVIGEEVGFFGITLMIVAFGVFAYRGLRIAFGAEDRYAMLLSSGIVTWIVMQAVINMMVNVGLLPNTGVPIPFISQGGSSIMAILAAVGVLLNISKFSDYSARSGNGLFQGSRFLRVIKRWR